MTPRPFGAYQFYRREPGRHILAPAEEFIPAIACARIGTTVNQNADSAPYCYRQSATVLFYTICNYSGGVNNFEIYKSIDNAATWVQKYSINIGAGGGRMQNCGFCELNTRLWAFFGDLSGGNHMVGYTWSVDNGETWQAYGQRITGITLSFGSNVTYWVSPWLPNSDRDQKAAGNDTDDLLVVGCRPASSVLYFWHVTWVAAYGAIASCNAAKNVPYHPMGIADGDNCYAAFNHSTSPYGGFAKVDKALFTTLVLTDWAHGVPSGASTRPCIWSEGGADAELVEAAAVNGALNYVKRVSLDQGGSWGGNQNQPVLVCPAVNLGVMARAHYSGGGALYDHAWSEPINNYGYHERA